MQTAASKFLDSCPFPPLLSLGLNPSQDQLLSLVPAQEGIDHPASGAVGGGGSSLAAGQAVGTMLHPWEFTPAPIPAAPKCVQGGTRGDVPPLPVVGASLQRV